jgi:hypothetical protein
LFAETATEKLANAKSATAPFKLSIMIKTATGCVEGAAVRNLVFDSFNTYAFEIHKIGSTWYLTSPPQQPEQNSQLPANTTKSTQAKFRMSFRIYPSLHYGLTSQVATQGTEVRNERDSKTERTTARCDHIHGWRVRRDFFGHERSFIQRDK